MKMGKRYTQTAHPFGASVLFRCSLDVFYGLACEKGIGQGGTKPQRKWSGENKEKEKLLTRVMVVHSGAEDWREVM